MRKLRRMFCRFPSEWDGNTMATRYGFVRELPAFQDAPGAWDDFEAHLNAITFTGLLADYQAAQWRVHPKEFIGLMRQCGWLSAEELKRIYPDSQYPITALATEGRGRTPDTIRNQYLIPLNLVTRKYFVNTPSRIIHFFGQGAVESMSLAMMVEGSANFSRNPRHASFQPEDNGYYIPTNPNDYLFYLEGRLGNVDAGDGPKFRGRGMKQLTGRENYSKYWIYRGWLDHNSFDSAWWTNRNRRRPIIDDPQVLSINAYNCIDAGGWYWCAGAASNQFATINTIVNDSEIDRVGVRSVARAINGINRQTGEPNGLNERINESIRIKQILTDRP